MMFKRITVRPLPILLVLAVIMMCVGTLTAGAAPVSPITLPSNQNTFSITLTADESAAFAGIEYGLKISDPDITFTFTKGVGIQNTMDSPFTEKDGVHYFGFYSTANVFSGHVAVGTLNFTGYTIDNAVTIEMVRVKIVRVNGTVTETSDGEFFTVVVQRQDGGTVTPYPITPPGQPSSPSPSSGSGGTEDINENMPPLAMLHWFDDVDEAHYAWALEAVDSLAEAGIVNGTAPRIYSPSRNIKRGDFMLMLVRAYDLSGSFNENFSDVPPDSYYYDAIGIAKKLGIAKGVGNNRFAPDAPITRQDMMVLVYRTLETAVTSLTEGSDADLLAFPDGNKVSDYARGAVATLVMYGIVQGTNTGLLNPLGFTTRAGMAVVLYRVLTFGG